MKKEMTDAQFFRLKVDIVKAESELRRLQREYKRQTGKLYQPFSFLKEA